MISTLRRQLAALAVVAVLFLFVACYLTFDRLAISDGVRSFIGGSTFEKYVGDVIPSTAGDTLEYVKFFDVQTMSRFPDRQN